MQALRELPDRVASVEVEIVQLRDEMHDAFSAMRSELRGEMRTIRDELRAEIQGTRDALGAEIHGIRDDLRLEIQAGNQETRTFMRMLYENNKETIKTMGEGKRKRKR